MKKISILLIAIIAIFTSCDSYNYKAVYTVNDENDNILFVDTVYAEGNEYAKLILWVDAENYSKLNFDNGISSDLLLKTKQKVDIISFEQLNKVE
jgi:hypothetical protein